MPCLPWPIFSPHHSVCVRTERAKHGPPGVARPGGQVVQALPVTTGLRSEHCQEEVPQGRVRSGSPDTLASSRCPICRLPRPPCGCASHGGHAPPRLECWQHGTGMADAWRGQLWRQAGGLLATDRHPVPWALTAEDRGTGPTGLRAHGRRSPGRGKKLGGQRDGRGSQTILSLRHEMIGQCPEGPGRRQGTDDLQRACHGSIIPSLNECCDGASDGKVGWSNWD